MRKVVQFQMTNWSRDGICSDPKTVMKMIDQLLIVQRRTGNKPILIHGVWVCGRVSEWVCELVGVWVSGRLVGVHDYVLAA